MCNFNVRQQETRLTNNKTKKKKEKKKLEVGNGILFI